MKKTFQLHLRMEHLLIEQLRKQAEESDLSLAELCRHKLKANTQLTRIERLLENLSNQMKGGDH